MNSRPRPENRGPVSPITPVVHALTHWNTLRLVQAPVQSLQGAGRDIKKRCCHVTGLKFEQLSLEFVPQILLWSSEAPGPHRRFGYTFSSASVLLL